MMQKLLIKIIEYLDNKYGPLIFAIIILGYFGYQNRIERLENIKFYRQQQVEWYKASEVQTKKVTNALEKNTKAWTENKEVLNELKIIVKILTE